MTCRMNNYNASIRIGATVYAVPRHIYNYDNMTYLPMGDGNVLKVAVPKVVKNLVILKPKTLYFEYPEEWFEPYIGRYYYVAIDDTEFLSYFIDVRDVIEADEDERSSWPTTY